MSALPLTLQKARNYQYFCRMGKSPSLSCFPICLRLSADMDPRSLSCIYSLKMRFIWINFYLVMVVLIFRGLFLIFLFTSTAFSFYGWLGIWPLYSFDSYSFILLWSLRPPPLLINPNYNLNHADCCFSALVTRDYFLLGPVYPPPHVIILFLSILLLISYK